MEIIFKIHSLVLLYTKKRDYQNSTNFDGKHMAVFIYIERKHFFLLLELGNQCLMWILASGSPKAYLKPIFSEWHWRAVSTRYVKLNAHKRISSPWN